MVLLLLIFIRFSSESEINIDITPIANFLETVYHKINTINYIFYKSIIQPKTISSLLSIRFEVPINDSNWQSKFPYLEEVTTKIYTNHANESYSKSDNQDKETRKLVLANPFSLVLLIIVIQLLNSISLIGPSLPFKNSKQFESYIKHLPKATKRLFKIMIGIHIFNIFMMFIDPDFIYLLFGQSTYFTFAKCQFWRIITSTLLHADLIHLFSNMLEFILVAPYYEKYVGKDFFYFHIYIVSILISIVEAAIHCFMYIIGFTNRIETLSVGFSGVIFALYVMAGYSARNIKQKHPKSRAKIGSKKNAIYVGSSSSSSSSPSPSLSPSHFYISGTNYSYRDFYSDPNTPYYILIVTFLLSPQASFTAHFAGIIVGEFYVHVLQPNNLVVKNEKFVKVFNICFPWILVSYFFFYFTV